MSGQESEQVTSKGILTLREGVMMPDGDIYKFIWHDDWINSAGVNIVRMKVRDSKGYLSEELHMAAFPHEISVGFAACDVAPTVRGVYVFGGSK